MKYKYLLFVSLLLLLLAASFTVLAQTSAGFNLEWHVLASGGGQSNSASYQVKGTIGQSASGPPAVSSSNFHVTGGFWAGIQAPYVVYLPMVTKN